MMREETKTRIEEIVAEGISRGETAGVLVLFKEGGEETFFYAEGHANLERGEKLRRDHIFRLFSMTKPVTAAAAMILVERGMLDLGQPVAQLIPGFEGKYVYGENGRVESAEKQMTVNHLLNMTSGLTYGGPDSPTERETDNFLMQCERKLGTKDEITTVEFARKLSRIPLAFNPDSSWMYGLSADVLGAVIECASGQRFGDFLKENLFDPLGMEDTGFYVPDEKQPRLADVYRCCGDGTFTPYRSATLALKYEMKNRPKFESGGAGLATTIDDYARFAQMLLNLGELDGRRVLKERTVEFLTSGDLTGARQAAFRRRMGLEGFTYSHLMRQMRANGSYSSLTRGREYGWDSWTGCYFTCIPEENRLMILMEQKAETGTTPMTRKIRNVWLADS